MALNTFYTVMVLDNASDTSVFGIKRSRSNVVKTDMRVKL